MTQSVRNLVVEYVRSGKLMQLATVEEPDRPAVCQVWYAPEFHPDRLYFMSRSDRKHSANVRQTSNVAGAIIAIDLDGLGQKVRGITFAGTAVELPMTDRQREVDLFCRRWPAARSALGGADDGGPQLYRVSISRWVLFDEVSFPDEPRREIPANLPTA